MQISNCKKTPIDNKYFGEGIVPINGKVYQQTWKEKTINIFSEKDMIVEGTTAMSDEVKEGWGLCDYDDSYLLATDGSEFIYFLDKNNIQKVVKKLKVTENGNTIYKLNEIKFIKGNTANEALINVYLTHDIIRVNLKTGEVVKRYNMESLISKELNFTNLTSEDIYHRGYCANGIAQISASKPREFLLTGRDEKG